MALKAAPADQALLLELQDLDSTLQRLTGRAAKLPEEAALTAIAAERDALRATAAEQTGTLEDARLELTRTQTDVEVVDARIARDQTRLEGSTSVKDIEGLQQELTALAKRKSDLEDIELAVMETVEERETALAATRAELDGLDDRTSAATAARDEAAAAIATEREQASIARDALAGRVPADLLDLYEKQRGRYGIGASLLRGGVSVAAGVTLTASDLRTVRTAAPDDVLLCPESQAVLVRTEESGL
jgi:uncharacterized protein